MVNADACKPWVCLGRGSTFKMGRKLSITVNLCEGAVRTRRVWTSASAMALVGDTQNSVIKWRRRSGWGWILLEWMEIKLDPTVKQFPWAALPWSIACVFLLDPWPSSGKLKSHTLWPLSGDWFSGTTLSPICGWRFSLERFRIPASPKVKFKFNDVLG